MAKVSIDKAYRRATNKECCCPEDNNNILTPPTTIYSVESNVLNIIDTQGTENGIPCSGYIKQELHFGADNISYPLIIPFTGTTFDLCGVDVTLLGLATGANTMHIKRVVEDCGGIAEYIDKVDMLIHCVSAACLITSQTLSLITTQQELIAKPSATETIWRLTSPNPAQHAINLIITNWTMSNFGFKWLFEDINGLPLWWSGSGITVVATTATTIDVKLNTTNNGWSGEVNIDTCKDDINQTGLSDDTNKDVLQQAYDTLPIGQTDPGTTIEFTLYELTPNGSQCVIDCQPQVLYDCWNFGTDEYDIMEPNYSGNFIHAVSEVKVNGTVINFAPLNTWLDVKSLLQAYANVASVGNNVGVSTDLIFNMSTISGTISSISLKFDVIGEFPLTQLSFGDANTCTAAGAATYMCWNKFYPNVFDNTNTGTFQPNVVDIRINGASIMSGATSLSTLDDVIAMLLSDSRVIGVSNNATSEPNLDLTISTVQGVTSIEFETAAPVLITFDLIASNEAVPCAIDHVISYRCWVKGDGSSGDCAPNPCFDFVGFVVDDVYYPFSAVVNTFAEFEAEMSALPIGFAGYTYQLIQDGVFAIVLNSKKANINVGVYYNGYTYPDPDGLRLLEEFTPPQPKLTICSF